MKAGVLAIALGVAACGKSSNRMGDDEGRRAPRKTEPPAKAGPHPECLAKTKALAPWFAALGVEASSYEIDFGYVLATVPRGPSPVVQKGDAVEITAKRIAAWDASEHNHVGFTSAIDEKADDARLVAGLKDMRAKLSPPPGDYDHTDDTQLRIDIDKDAPWGSVVRVLKAAKDAGYAKAVLAVTATSQVVVPVGTDPWTQSEKEVDAADAKLDELDKKCPALRYAEMDKVAPGLADCDCAVDPDEVAKQLFISKRWHQAVPRTSITVLLGDGGTTISEAFPTPWSKAVEAVLAAAPEKGAPPTLSFELAKR